MGLLNYKKLPGIWYKEGKEYHSNNHKDFSILLVERSNPKPKQPGKYILAILPNGQREYISGIPGNNKIDYQGKYFKVDVSSANQIIIV